MKAQIYIKYHGNNRAATYLEELDFAFFEIVLVRHINEIKELLIKPISGSTQETGATADSDATSLSKSS